MKKLLLLTFSLLIGTQSFGQDPTLFKTWDLYRIEIKFSQGVLISDVDPAIAPTLTIDPTLDFSGFGACNGFSGSFLYLANDDQLEQTEYIETLTECETGYVRFQRYLNFYGQNIREYSYKFN